MKTNEKNYSLNLWKDLQNDNFFLKSVVREVSELTSISVRKGLEEAIVCEGQLVNVVSNAYGQVPNEKFFCEVEAKLIEAGIGYRTRSINRGNRSFAVDYILSDDILIVKVKNDLDRIRHMLRGRLPKLSHVRERKYFWQVAQNPNSTLSPTRANTQDFVFCSASRCT